MTTGSNPGKLTRRIHGAPRPIGSILPAVTRPALRSAGAAAAALMADWADVVGPALAAVSAPRRFSAGTLTLNCAGPAAMELQHLSVQLVERINGHLGQPLVQRLRLVQHAPNPRPVVPPRPPHAVPVRVVDGLPAGPLRDALQRLGGRIDSERA